MPKRSGSARPSGGPIFSFDDFEAVTAIQTLAARFRSAAEQLDGIALRDDRTDALEIDDSHRLEVALRRAGESRDDVAWWIQVLAHVALAEGFTKHAVAKALRVTDHTVARWVNEWEGDPREIRDDETLVEEPESSRTTVRKRKPGDLAEFEDADD